MHFHVLWIKSKPVVVGMLSLVSIALAFASAVYFYGLENVRNFLIHPATAAWIQAIGSVAAIGIAIWISGDSERTAKQHAVLHAKLFGRAAEAAVGGMHVVMLRSSAHKSRFLGELREVALVGQSIPLALLPSALVEPIFEMKSLVGRTIALATENNSRDGDLAQALVSASWERAKELNIVIQA